MTGISGVINMTGVILRPTLLKLPGRRSVRALGLGGMRALGVLCDAGAPESLARHRT
jgi:hypothetical protein